MNWYRYSQLDPDAWGWHGETHRLLSDKPYSVTPYGHIIQPMRSQEELEHDYRGVHVSPDIHMAMIYANNLGSQDDPPIIFEIRTSKGWELDIDSLKSSLDINTFRDWIDIGSIKEKISRFGINKDIIRDIMDDVENSEIYMDNESSDSVIEIIHENRNISPYSVIEFFDRYYGEYSEEMFYRGFILPVVYGEGDIDKRLIEWLESQMRFMSSIPREEVTAIYTFEPFSQDIALDYDEDEEYDESGRRKLTYDEILSENFNLREIWRRSDNNELLPQVFETYYHGTNRSRGMTAYPEFSSILNQI